MAEDKSNINFESNSANKGLNMDNTPSQIEKGSLSYALNAALENFDANGINYQNEPGNELCLTFPRNYVIVGRHYIQERSRHIFMLANPVTGGSEIGYMDSNDCQYHTSINDSCLGFDVNNPIHKITHRITNCSTEIYWPDQYGMRYMDIDNIPYKLKPNSDICDPDFSTELDCNKLRIQPDFAIPTLSITDIRSGGNIIAGTVQFAFQYSDALANPYTSYFSVTNPTPIFDSSQVTVNFNYPVGKSVVVSINNIDLSGRFKYFNLAVIKTVNDITSVELIGTFQITDSIQEITYSGQKVDNIRLTVNDVFEKFPIYTKAEDVTTASDVLIWKGLSTQERVNYQSIANKIELQWQTWRIPPTKNYSDELLATNFRSYLRDEVYSLEFVPILGSGKQCDGFHLPGRELSEYEKNLQPINRNINDDFISTDDDSDEEPYWKVYNTATVTGFSPNYTPDESYEGPYQYGDFSYWESELEYPCDKELWGDLAGKKIRHHKFPDIAISPIHEARAFEGSETMTMGNNAIFPIGIKINIEQVKFLIATSNLTQEQKDDIVGFKIVRGNRGTNKSIIAKGIIRNVNKYTREEEDFYFPNYPYNDLREDPFINSVNNAWAQECKSYKINILGLSPADSTSSVPYIKIEYTDCNNNKSNTKIYTSHIVEEICSLSMPRIASPQGTAGIKEADFDLYRITSTGTALQFCQGWRAKWTDASNVIHTEWVEGWPTNSPYVIEVKRGTSPVCVENCDACGITIQRIAEVKATQSCNIEIPLAPVTSHPETAYRQIFNSPETSFGQPFLGDVLKMESVMYGVGKGHFVQVKDNAKYKLITRDAQRDALKSSQKVGNITNPSNAAAMFTVYQSYLTIYINGITKKNYAHSFNSIADYNYSEPVPDNLGVKQRKIDLKKYLIPVVQSVGEQDININNYNRETSVYLRTDINTSALPYADRSPNMLLGAAPKLTEYSRFTISETGKCATPEKEQDLRVVSYYASMKNIFPGQWGQIYSYETVDTGFQRNLSTTEAEATIFGGDTFISRFAFKTKLPFFIDNRVGAPDESDIFFDELGNIGYPKYWHSARSILSDYSITGLGTLVNIVSYKAHNFDCPNDQTPGPPAANPNRTFYDGYFYLFAYGVPYFYVESSYNVDLRQAFNNKEGEFWPHVSSGIPDNWFQETNVSILNDNTYNYNVTYSKQNKENLFTHLPPDWKSKKCFVEYPFRAIFSDKETADANNRVNNWLTYRATSYFDFPQNYGLLTSLDGIENRQVLARFENKSLLYNALYTTQTNVQGQVYLGQSLFSAQTPPLDYAETDLGYVGSQHKFLLKLPYGPVTIDAKRGQVFLLSGNQAKDLSAPGSGMNRFFTDHLAFEILRFFPGINVDNNYNGIGLHGVFDSKYDRMIITKLDYVPLSNNIKLEDNIFYLEETVGSTIIRKEISLLDTNYFCNRSWTVSYSFVTNSWISFHSYMPNWYIGDNNFFYSGINSCCDGEVDFDFIVGELVPTPSTTSTTTSFVPVTTTSTTTEIPFDCTLEGTVVITACELVGDAQLIQPTLPEVCQRPIEVKDLYFRKGYTSISPAAYFDTTINPYEACAAISTINADPANNTPSIIQVYAINLEVGQTVYKSNGTNNCEVIENGWYYTGETAFSNQVFRVEDGIIVEYFSCDSLTTTTSTTEPAVQTFKVSVDESQPFGVIYGVSPVFYTMASIDAFPVESGQLKTGVVNSGGSTITVAYWAFDEPVQLIVIKNNLVVANDIVPSGSSMSYSYSITWTSLDTIEVILTKSP